MTPSWYLEGSQSSASTLAPSSPSSSPSANALVPSSPSSSVGASVGGDVGAGVGMSTFAAHLFAHSWLLSRQSLVQKKSKEQPVGGGIRASMLPRHTLQLPLFDQAATPFVHLQHVGSRLAVAFLNEPVASRLSRKAWQENANIAREIATHNERIVATEGAPWARQRVCLQGRV